MGTTESQLETILKNIEASRGLLDGFKRRIIIQAKPTWMDRTDELLQMVKDQEHLLKAGKVYWGALVQANRLLFSAGKEDHPAMLVYAKTNVFDANPNALANIAHDIYALKDTTPENDDLKAVAESVTDELKRKVSVSLPHNLTEKDVFSSTFLVYRRHLPNQVLSQNTFPILVSDDRSSVMIVPSKFWTTSMKQNW